MANLARIVTDSAARSSGHPALKLSEEVVTYGQLDELVARCAALLRSLGVEPGDRVGVMVPNVPQFAVAYYGVLRCGGIVVPMNILLKGRETTFYLSDPEAKAVFAWHEFLESARTGAEAAGAEVIPVAPGEFEQRLAGHEPLEMVEVGDEDTAVVLYTSGTTGTPKGAELTHANLYTQAAILADDLFHMTADDVVLGALPLFHAFGQSDALNAPLYAGATVTMLPRFAPRSRWRPCSATRPRCSWASRRCTRRCCTRRSAVTTGCRGSGSAARAARRYRSRSCAASSASSAA
jgi:long-chain acyl-CoA synthetase